MSVIPKMPEPFTTTDAATDARNEIIDQFNGMLNELRKGNEDDAYKTCIVANLLTGTGIRMLVNMGCEPNALLQIIVHMIKNALDGSDESLVIVPEDIVATVKRREGKPS